MGLVELLLLIVEAPIELLMRPVLSFLPDIDDSRVDYLSYSGRPLALQLNIYSLVTNRPIDKVHSTSVCGKAHVTE